MDSGLALRLPLGITWFLPADRSVPGIHDQDPYRPTWVGRRGLQTVFDTGRCHLLYSQLVLLEPQGWGAGNGFGRGHDVLHCVATLTFQLVGDLVIT